MQAISQEFSEKELRQPSVYQVGLTVKIVDVKEDSFNGYPFLTFKTDLSEDEGLSFSSFTKPREGRFITLKTDPTTGSEIEVADALPTSRYPKGTAVDEIKKITSDVMALPDKKDRTYGKLAEFARTAFVGKSIKISSQGAFLDKGGKRHDLKNYDFVAE